MAMRKISRRQVSSFEFIKPSKNFLALNAACRTWSFHVVVLQRAAKKCTNIYNARAQPLFCSLNLLFGNVFVVVVVVVCLSSLLIIIIIIIIITIIIIIIIKIILMMIMIMIMIIKSSTFVQKSIVEIPFFELFLKLCDRFKFF